MFRVLACLSLLLLSAPFARADVAIPIPGIDRTALADNIAVGKVAAIEPQDIQVGPENAKTTYRIAVVNISEMILGNKETKTIRVAFPPTPGNPAVPPRRQPVFQFKLDAGQHGLLYLRKHPTENLYLGTNAFDFVAHQDEKDPPNANLYFGHEPYQQQLKSVRRIIQLLEKPMESLKAMDAADRAAVAHHLIARYRTPKGGKAKLEPISVEETRLILAALLEQDWSKPTPTMNSWQRFNSLGLTQTDGWKTPARIQNANDLRDAARAWHRDHADYRIQRYVAESAK